MKKFVSLALALVLVLALSVTVFAAQGTQDIASLNTGNTSAVTVSKINDRAQTDTYKVTITWTAITDLVWNKGGEIWDVDSHTWTETSAAGWAETKQGSVTLKSDSSADLTVNVTSDEEAVVVTNGTNLTLDAWNEEDGQGTLTVNFAAANTAPTATGTIATITVTISAALS